MAAAVFGMDYFHHYLVGRPFHLLTDHKPLVPLSTVHTKTLNRLQLKMQDLHPTLAHIPGKDNVIPDFLSRYSSMGVRPSPSTSLDASAPVASVDISTSTFRPLQDSDDLCRTIADFLRPLPTDPAGHYHPCLLYTSPSPRDS